jgi:hypothetical protein
MAEAGERRILRLAEMTAALREGTQNHFEVTRLTSLKSLCQDRAIAMRFALYLAERAQAQLNEESRSGWVEQDEWKRYNTLAAEAVRAMRAYLASPTQTHQASLYEHLSQVREAQNEITRPMGKYTVRIIHSSELLVIEDAL